METYVIELEIHLTLMASTLKKFLLPLLQFKNALVTLIIVTNIDIVQDLTLDNETIYFSNSPLLESY